MKLKLISSLLAITCLTACWGQSSTDNTLIGQVKKVQHATPIICSNYERADISLGVMRNGVGSMSSQDVWVYVPNADDFKVLSDAASSGALVKVTYDVERVRWCVPEETITKVELVK